MSRRPPQDTAATAYETRRARRDRLLDGKSNSRAKRTQLKLFSRREPSEMAAKARRFQSDSFGRVEPSFKFLKCIGKGSFGAVFKARELHGSRRLVAIKRVALDPNYVNRELEILTRLNHESCVRLLGHFHTDGTDSARPRLNLVMEFLPTSLEDFIGEAPYDSERGLALLRLHARQIFVGLEYLHARGVCHRDIKPQNILVDPETDRVALCDFGSAKVLSESASSVAYIGSRFYRAPELLLGREDYGVEIDVWSAGCVVAEMALKRPLFDGRNTSEQLRKVVETLGRQAKRYLLKTDTRHARLADLPPGPSLSDTLASVPELARFLCFLLRFDAAKRPTATEALAHPFLAEAAKSQ